MNKQELAAQIWKGANEMRGKIEAGNDFSQVCERSSQWCELRYSQVQTAH